MYNIVHELLKSGLTKYRISKILGCAYNTVSMWDKGVWHPSEKYEQKLEELLKSANSDTKA
jgi:hypothetical protein